MKGWSTFHIPYLLTGLFLFYAAVTGNYIDGLLGSGMHDLLQQHWAKHLIGFLILLFTISIVAAASAWTSLWLSGLLYFWFVLTTKVGKWTNLTLILLLAAGFFIKQLLIKDYTREWAMTPLHSHERRRRLQIRAVLTQTVVALFGVIIAAVRY